jgi:competence protein ComEA
MAQQKILFGLALFILALLFYKFYYPALTSSREKPVREFVVEVSGGVRKPGIYIFHHPPTLKEAIEKAEGLREEALFDEKNLSETLETGSLVHVTKESHPPSSPSVSSRTDFAKGPPSPPPFSKGGHGEIKEPIINIKLGRMEARKLIVFSLPLDLNRASVEDLSLVPGIGDPLGREIVAYRERRRAFRSVEELRNVKGVSEKKYESLKTYFTVR